MNKEYTFRSNNDQFFTVKYDDLRSKFIHYSFMLSILDLPDEEVDSINLEVKKLRDEYKLSNGME